MAASVLLTIGPQPELLDTIVQKASALLPGQSGNKEMGPVIDEASRVKIIKYIQESEQQGAHILLDGRKWLQLKKQGFYIGPTIIVHKKKSDAALHDEIFGPVLSVYQVQDKEEAIAIENANPYGNAGMCDHYVM
jgi:malonate-semialdehyde dehydrogenase (acetylating)/methylmalonate-semialdehyde dehydrogenase